MEYIVDIPDGSALLEELEDCVKENNAMHPDKQVTAQEYVNNIINGWLTNRVLDIYAGHAKKLPIDVLEEKFGKIKSIKDK